MGGGANGPAYVGLVSDTKFSTDRGFYDTNFTIAITSATVGATIRYTTNLTAPSATQGLLYSSPINIRSTTILRAAAFKDGWAPTDVDTHTYVFPSNVIAASVMSSTITKNTNYAPQIKSGLLDVPSLSIVTTGTINDTSETKSSIEWLRADGAATAISCSTTAKILCCARVGKMARLRRRLLLRFNNAGRNAGTPTRRESRA